MALAETSPESNESNDVFARQIQTTALEVTNIFGDKDCFEIIDLSQRELLSSYINSISSRKPSDAAAELGVPVDQVPTPSSLAGLLALQVLDRHGLSGGINISYLGGQSEIMYELGSSKLFGQVGELETELEDTGLFNKLFDDLERLLVRAQQHGGKTYNNNEQLIRSIWAISIQSLWESRNNGTALRAV